MCNTILGSVLLGVLFIAIACLIWAGIAVWKDMNAFEREVRQSKKEFLNSQDMYF